MKPCSAHDAAQVCGVVLVEYATVTSLRTRLALSTAQGMATLQPSGRPSLLDEGGGAVAVPVQSTPTFPQAATGQHTV